MTDHATDPAILIRDAAPADYPQVAELIGDAYITGGFLSPDDPYLADLQDVRYRVENARVIIAETAGQVTGSVTLIEADQPLAEVAKPGELEIRMLAVSPQAQGLGIGRSLLRYSLETARRRADIAALTLCSMPTMTTAHALYRSEGFRAEPQRDFVIETPHHSLRFPFFINSFKDF